MISQGMRFDLRSRPFDRGVVGPSNPNPPRQRGPNLFPRSCFALTKSHAEGAKPSHDRRLVHLYH